MEVGWVRADICGLGVDVVVNAANAALAGGGGVDGAIHRAAGYQVLRTALDQIGGCPTGSAVLTPGFALPARWIAHAVGPVWRGGSHTEAQHLAGAYRMSLDLADSVDAHTVASAALSCGVYGYPIDEAMSIAVHAVSGWSAEHPQSSIQRFDWAVFNDDVALALESLIGPAGAGSES